jgi:hypothetical protein
VDPDVSNNTMVKNEMNIFMVIISCSPFEFTGSLLTFL